MTPDQRKALVFFHTTKIKSARFSALSSKPNYSCSNYSHQKDDSSGSRFHSASGKMSISVENCNISTLPQATLMAIWIKAKEYFKSNNGVLAATGSDKKLKMVAAHYTTTPHFVTI